ncbi:MAG: extracellular solute-binding protein [Candidatus Omnitrophota bacterium]|jgi:iron(III) transport system substrate-binding protein
MRKFFVLVCALVFMSSLIGWAETGKNREVVIYTSLDQIFSEPILGGFEKKTGIKVKVVYDTEAAKTAGLVNRLIAEKDNPNADVFWNNEIARTIILKKMGLLQAYVSPESRDIPDEFKDADGCWAGFAARARVLIYNTRLLSDTEAPQSIFELTGPKWKGKVTLGNPLFGTTATHFAALFVSLGAEKTKEYLSGLRENGIIVVPGNSVSRDRVVDGEVPVGFTDTDDAWMAISEGKSVKMIFPDTGGIGTLLIPNTVCLIKNCPHPEEGRQLIDYLLSKEVEEKLAFSPSMQIPLRKDVQRPAHVPAYDSLSIMKIDFAKAADILKESSRYIQETFLQ